MSIADNITHIREEIACAANDAGIDPASVTLCAATKMNNASAVQEAIRAGIDCCGENRVQELLEKIGQDAYRGVPVHFIGHLQTNKVRQVVGRVALIQSVDSKHLLDCIQREAAAQDIVQNILLEINIGSEASKTGFSVETIPEILEEMPHYPNICVRGLMAIPPICHESGGNVKFFRKMQHLYVDIRAKKYDNVSVDCLSMGMSGDYPDAIRCGSTMVRIGTAIFGARDYAMIHRT